MLPSLLFYHRLLPSAEISSLNNLGGCYVNQDKYEQAEPLLLRALAIRKKSFEANHPSIATTLNNLAILYSKQEKFRQAEPLFLQALAIRNESLGPDHPDTKTLLKNYSELLDKRKDA